MMTATTLVVLDAFSLHAPDGRPRRPGQRLHEAVANGDALVDRLGLELRAGESVALVGESGAGKTMTALAIANALPPGVTHTGGTLTRAPRATLAMVFQDARAALNPVRRIGDQIADVLAVAGVRRAERRVAATALLHRVGLEPVEDNLARYPFELSGGMCQRALIAMALARQATLLIADEPTTGLDETHKNIVMDLLLPAPLAASHSSFDTTVGATSHATLLITHDLGLAVSRCDRIVVMHRGQVVEEMPAADFINAARHPYSRALIEASPRFARTLSDLRASSSAPTPAGPGCRYRTRCERGVKTCENEFPPDIGLHNGKTYCWNPCPPSSYVV